MSLDDQFNKSDGGIIDTVDHFYFNVHKKVAEYWQNKTYKNKSVLEATLFGVAAIGLSLDGIFCKNYFQNVVAFLPARDSYRAIHGTSSRMTGTDMEHFSESMGLPKKFFKGMYALMLTGGLSSIVVGTAELGTALYTGDSHMLQRSLQTLPWAIGFTSWISAQYMQRSDIGEPPPKPKKKPVLAKIKEYLDSVGEAVDGLVPAPEPRMIPIRTKYSSD